MGAASSPRSPESLSNQCPLCATVIAGDLASADGQLPCPHCGSALAFLRTGQGIRFHAAKEVAPVRKRVVEVITGKFDVQPEQLHGLITFEELGADSLDVAETIMELEHQFDLTIEDEEANQLRSINDIVNYIVRRIGAK